MSPQRNKIAVTNQNGKPARAMNRTKSTAVQRKLRVNTSKTSTGGSNASKGVVSTQKKVNTNISLSVRSRYAFRSNAFSLPEDTQLPAATSKKRKRSEEEPSSSAKQPMIECIACGDAVPCKRIISLSCNHTYCRDCLRELISVASKNEDLFPPRCCNSINGGDIPDTIIKRLLSVAELRAYRLSQREFATPGELRLYCPKDSCGRFVKLPVGIKPGKTWGLVKCGRCRTEICFGCRSYYHQVDLRCVESADEDLEEIMNLAEVEGWRRCKNCLNMVERTFGCHRMSCRCGYKFCYRCGGELPDECNCLDSHLLAPDLDGFNDGDFEV